MLVPQTKLLDVEIWKGTEFVPLASIAIFGYVALPCVTVTPAVEVVSVAEMADSVAQPLFLTPRLRLMHSFLLITPLLLPEVASSMVTPFDWRFDVPVMQKFCAAEPLPGTVTEAEEGVLLVQLRAVSAAVAV